jgi:hypothetical protein
MKPIAKMFSHFDRAERPAGPDVPPRAPAVFYWYFL